MDDVVIIDDPPNPPLNPEKRLAEIRCRLMAEHGMTAWYMWSILVNMIALETSRFKLDGCGIVLFDALDTNKCNPALRLTLWEVIHLLNGNMIPLSPTEIIRAIPYTAPRSYTSLEMNMLYSKSFTPELYSMDWIDVYKLIIVIPQSSTDQSIVANQ